MEKKYGLMLQEELDNATILGEEICETYEEATSASAGAAAIGCAVTASFAA